MKKIFKSALAALLIVPTIAFGTAAVVSSPVDAQIRDGANSARGDDTPGDLFGDGGIFRTIVNILLFLIGAVAVIMLIIGGIRYVVSGGDSSNVTAAKNTILYAVIGIVVAILAYAIVNWVIGAIPTN